MFGLGFLDAIKIGAGVALGAMLAVYPAILIGRHEGRQQAATAALSKSVEILRKRNDINDQVSTSDASVLCASMGLSDDDKTECVRRVLSPDAEPGDVGIDPAD
jgi:hypothetical protein